MLAGAAAAAVLAFPGIANAAVNSTVAAGALTVTSDAADPIAITSAGGNVKINGADPGTGAVASNTITSIAVTGGPAPTRSTSPADGGHVHGRHRGHGQRRRRRGHDHR